MSNLADAMARRRAERDGHIQLAADLAAHLPGWRHDPAAPQPSMLYGPDGGRLLVDIVGHGQNRRVHIIPKFPDNTPFLDQYRSKTITAALGRTAAAIAHDISTRLLPGYIADLHEKIAIVESQKDDRDLQRERADQILALHPGCLEQPRWFAEPERLLLALPAKGAAEAGIALDLGERHSVEFKRLPYPLLRQLVDTYLDYDQASTEAD